MMRQTDGVGKSSGITGIVFVDEDKACQGSGLGNAWHVVWLPDIFNMKKARL
jgi:hypothetical protein